MQAAELFEQEIKPPEVARRLRVSRKSAYQWHQLWRQGGERALASCGASASRCRLSPRCLEKLAVAGLIAMRPGSRTRPCHRLRTHPAGKSKRRSMGERDFIALIDGAHQLVKAPIVLV